MCMGMEKNGEGLLIFVVGNSRSGTTMLRRVLGNHLQIYMFDELDFFEQQVNAVTVLNRPTWNEE